MNRPFRLTAALAVVLAVVGVLAAASMSLSTEPRPKSCGEVTHSPSPLGIDQLQYRSENGRWRLSVDGVEKPYV